MASAIMSYYLEESVRQEKDALAWKGATWAEEQFDKSVTIAEWDNYLSSL